MRARVVQGFILALGLLLPAAVRAAEEGNLSKEAAGLLAKATDISRIRSVGAPPFHLRARVRIFGLPGGPFDGTYSLIWLSPERWREETNFADYEQVRVGGANKFWLKRNTHYQPLRAYQLEETLELTRHLGSAPEADHMKIRERTRQGTHMRCIEIKWKEGGGKELCFDSATGALRWEKSLRSAYEYTDHVAWGNKLFPRGLRYYEDGSLIVEARVEELTGAETSEVNLFSAPPGAEEWPSCASPEPARPLEQRMPRYPQTAIRSRLSGDVSVYAIVGIDGELHNPTVVRAADPELNAAAVTALKSWRYRPAMCGSTPIPTETIIDVNFFVLP